MAGVGDILFSLCLIASGLLLGYLYRNRFPQGMRQTEEEINQVRLLRARGWFDEDKCGRGLEALSHYRRDFNERMGEFKDSPCMIGPAMVLTRLGAWLCGISSRSWSRRPVRWG